MIPSGFIRMYLCTLLGLPIDSDSQIVIEKLNEVKRELEKMYKKKNYEKYKTPDEAYNAWRSFCKAQQRCSGCKYEHCECILNWLYDEAKEEQNEK